MHFPDCRDPHNACVPSAHTGSGYTHFIRKLRTYSWDTKYMTIRTHGSCHPCLKILIYYKKSTKITDTRECCSDRRLVNLLAPLTAYHHSSHYEVKTLSRIAYIFANNYWSAFRKRELNVFYHVERYKKRIDHKVIYRLGIKQEKCLVSGGLMIYPTHHQRTD